MTPKLHSLAAGTLISAFVFGSSFASEPIVGSDAKILDGDTVQIGEARIRLLGIDAPESDQVCLDPAGKTWACGVAARDALANKSAGLRWVCQVTGRDRYERTLATCAVAGEDIQKWMVRDGWALSFVRYSRTYDSDEAMARSSKSGLWEGAFIAPWDWRARNPRTAILGAASVPSSAIAALLSRGLAQMPPADGCLIKGNVNRRGECIFHTLGSRHYDSVKMDLSKGKRWFCSATDALAAGCRAPR